MEANNELTTKPIAKLIRQIAIPSAIGFFFNTLYNVVDAFFGGRLSTEALAAMTLSFPVFFIIIAIGSGVSTGATALIAHALGEGDQEKGRIYSVQSITFGLILSVFLTWLGLAFSPFLFKMLGAQGQYLALALTYTNIIFYGTVFFMANFILNSVLNAEGNTKTYRNLLIMGFFLNVALDPWFIYGGFGVTAMGLAGVAWSTILIQLITAVILFIKVAKTKFFCRECFGMIKPKLAYYLEIAKQGFPASLNMMTVAIGVFVITFYISRFGRVAVAAYGVATRIDQIILLPTIGLNVAALTLAAQNNGAKLFNRVRETASLTLKYGLYVTFAGMAIVLIFSRLLIRLFSADQSVISIGSTYLKISALVYFAYAVLFITVAILQGLKKPFFAIWIGLYRQIIAPLVIFWLMAMVLGFGLKGIWWGIFLVNWSGAIIGLLYLNSNLKKLG